MDSRCFTAVAQWASWLSLRPLPNRWMRFTRRPCAPLTTKSCAPGGLLSSLGKGVRAWVTLFAEAEFQEDPSADDDTLNSARKKPLRAPMIIAVIAKVTPDLPKVPKMEQVISAGCAAHGILLAAHAQGLGAMWRSGKYAFDPVVRKGLSLEEDDEVVAFIYLGHLGGRHKPLPAHNVADFVERWA